MQKGRELVKDLGAKLGDIMVLRVTGRDDTTIRTELTLHRQQQQAQQQQAQQVASDDAQARATAPAFEEQQPQLPQQQPVESPPNQDAQVRTTAPASE